MLTCQQVKCEHKKPGGVSLRMPIPTWKWERITMDFVVKSTTEKLVELYISQILPFHGVPISIISNRGAFLTTQICRDLLHGLDFSCEEEPIAILDMQIQKLRIKVITSVKVQWKHCSVGEVRMLESNFYSSIGFRGCFFGLEEVMGSRRPWIHLAMVPLSLKHRQGAVRFHERRFSRDLVTFAKIQVPLSLAFTKITSLLQFLHWQKVACKTERSNFCGNSIVMIVLVTLDTCGNKANEKWFRLVILYRWKIVLVLSPEPYDHSPSSFSEAFR
ncbi:hypothetical protein MTR67_001490 [Solanum verrucosum]|uniref:Uncharacterized protein n=1 Tax=Solanum verrucosum TaxID=315347 RepID=A0AAF0PQP3_SOLVR|nr:hypothetical protein MTR67_001490 [Solanum verrucosum]